MDLASTACAIQNLWLAARAEGIGVGWVSFFDPDALATLLNMPAGARPIAILCLGQAESFPEQPLLEQLGWGRAPSPRTMDIREPLAGKRRANADGLLNEPSEGEI
jgi:5,6-dimethylbenzimidazole synthase